MWERLHNDFKKVRAAPKICILDNENSKDLIDSFVNKKIQYQLVVPYKYRNNQAEWAI